MNERIRELSMNCAHKMGNSLLYNAEFIEEFAELIVRECAEFVRYKAEKSMSQEVLYVGNDLLKHFGVEE